MHNPSQPLRSSADHGLTPHELVDFLARSHRWSGKGARALARAVATALDEALRPGVVLVALGDPATGATVTAVDGQAREAAALAAEQWHEWLAPRLPTEANHAAVDIPRPGRSGKLRLRVARVGADGSGGYIALASADRAFPGERAELLLEVAAGQAGLILETLRAAAAREHAVEEAPAQGEPRGDRMEARLAPGAREEPRRAQPPELRLVADAMPGLVGYVDRQHIYRFANRCYQDWFGLAPADVVGRHVADVLGEEAYSEIRPSIERALAGERVTYEARLRHSGEEGRFVQGQYIPNRDGDGSVKGFFTLTQDIGERKRAEMALAQSEEHHRRLLGLLPMAVYTCDAEGRITFYNRGAAELWGREPAPGDTEQKFCGSYRLWSPDGRLLPHVDTPMARAIRTGESVRNQEVVVERPDGSRIFVSVNIDALRDGDGRIRGATNAFQDVTARKRLDEERTHMLETEREARAEAELLRDLGLALNSDLDLQAVLQRVTDAATEAVGAQFGSFFYNTVNEQGEAYALYTLSGAPREAFERFPLPRNTALFGPTFRGEAIVRCDDVKRDPRYGRSEPYRGPPPGHLPVTSYLAVPVRSRSGEVLGGLFFGHREPGRFSANHERIVAGIAAQAAAAIDNARLFDAVREQAERLRITHAQAPMGIADADPDGRFQTVNDRFCRIVGYAREELVGRYIAEITHPEDAAAGADHFRRLIAGEIESYQIEKRYVHKEGQTVWVRLSVALVRDAAGAPRYTIGVIEDIGERRLAEERDRFLMEASKRLAASLDYARTLADVAQLAVPAIADWCAVDMVAPDGALTQLAVAHADPEKVELAKAFRLRFPPNPTAPNGPSEAARAGRTEIAAEVSDELLARLAHNPEHLAGLRRFNIASYACAPLIARGRTLGVVTFLQTDSARRFSEADRDFIEELARRAALAIDSAQLFEAVREQAERLQATYNRAAIGISEVALDGRFLGVNERFCAVTGYTREELLARRFQDITHPDDVDADAVLFRDLLAGKIESYTQEKRYIRKDGTHVWGRVTVSVVRDAEGRPKYGIGAIEDITERHRAETVISGQKQALERMARGEPLATVLETLVETFERQSSGSASGSIFLLDAERRSLRPLVTGRPEGAWTAAVQEVPAPPEICSCETTAEAPSVDVADIETDARWAPFRGRALEYGFRGGWTYCLRGSGGGVLGTFALLCREARAPAGQEARFIELIADTAVNAIERYRDETSLRAQAEVLSQVHDAVVMIGLDGRVLRWNAGAERLLEIRPDEALGRTLAELTPSPEAYAWLEANVIEAVKRDGRYEGTVPLLRASGARLHAHMSASLVQDEDGSPGAIVAYVLDVTARVRAEKALAARVRQQEAVAWFGKAALAGIGLPTLMDEAVRLVADTLGAELCKVLELEPEGARLVLRAGVGWNEGLVGTGTVSADVDTQAGFTLVSKEPVVVTDLRTETRFTGPGLLHWHGVISGMSVVIYGDRGDAYGVLSAHSRRRRNFSGHDVNFLQSMAHILASAIQRKRFEEAMRRARDELESRVAGRTAELAQANQSLRDEVVERMGVETALRESEAQYRMLFERNPLPAWVFDIHTLNILAANETAVWQYGYTRDEFLRMNVHDLHPSEETSRALDYAEQFAPETAYIGMWKHRKQDETVIDVEVFVYEVLFQGRWARLMLASDISERRRTEREFRLLESITRSISEAPDLDAALYAVLRHVCETTGWALGEAWLPAADGTHMQCSRAWYCGADGLEEFRHAAWELELERGHGVIGRAWATGQPTWVADVAEDETFGRAAEAQAAGVRAAITFPVLAEGEVVALLTFFLREPWLEDEHQVKLVSTIGRQAGIAIQRKKVEDRLRESEERFRLLVEGAHDYAIYMVDPEGRVASWNRGAERLEGYSAEEVLGRPVTLFYVPEEAGAGTPERMLAHARTTGVYEGEGWRVRKGGERFWASVVMTALRDARGGLRGFVKVTRDITERKQAEERLKQSEARLARAQEFSLLMVAHVALDGRWLKVPPMLCATLAYREEEMLASRFEDVTHPDDFAAEWEQCQWLIRGEAKSFDLEKRFLRRDGTVIWAYQNTSIVLDAEDRPLHFLSFIRDITQRKEAEEQLHRSRVQLSEAQRLAHLGSWEWDVASGRLEWSEELYRIYGMVPRTPITYETYMAHVYPEDRERVYRAVAASLETQQPFTVEERIVRADGELRHLLSQGAAVAGPKGEVARMVGVCLDITERKHSEERLHEYTHRLQGLSQRLLEAQETERRRIARELHDQIGQDLSVIKINLQALQRLPGADALGAPLDETVRIVEGVLATARNLSVELRPSMLDDLGLVAALRWYLDRQAQRAGITLHFAADEIGTHLSPTIETACFRLAQEALTNVLRHAAADRVNVTLQNKGEQLEMRITDDGKGCDVENARARASRGESFGLLGMEERALLAGGQLEIISAPGRGTTVVARFPLTSNTVQVS